MAAEIVEEGLQYIMESAFIQGSQETSFYIGLSAAVEGDIAEDDTEVEAAASEISSQGTYSRQEVTADVTATGFSASESPGVTNDWRVVTVEVDFTAAGDDFSAAVNSVFMCTSASGSGGTLIAWAPLSAQRTITDGSTLTVTMTLQITN